MSVISMRSPVVLEPASQRLVEATVGPPFLHELSPAEARAVLDELQAAPIDKLPVNDRWITVRADVGGAPPTSSTRIASQSPTTRSAAT